MINYLLSKHLKKHGIRTVYDLADHLPDMIRTNPQVPWLLRPVAGFVAGKLLDSNLRNASAVTVSAKDLIEGMELGKYNVKYIPNGVDLKRFRPRKDKHKGVIIGYVGALREWVDLRPMLIAVKALTGYKLRVLVVGGESDLPQYRDFVKKNGMEKLVTFTGNVPFDEIPKYINMMDITTVPFRKNKVTDGTCPLKLLEYLACEKPAICSRLNEIESMLANRVLYADTAREWEKQISTLYHDEILRETLGKQGREYVQEHFDWKIICEDMEKVLEANSKEG
jgi:glycosyltransferase involved in cell wall biosynthesis